MLTAKEKEKVKELIINVQEGFDTFAATLENEDDFNKAMNELIDYLIGEE